MGRGLPVLGDGGPVPAARHGAVARAGRGLLPVLQAPGHDAPGSGRRCGRPTARRSSEYWEEGLREIEMDDVTRGYLQSIAQLEFLTAPLGRLGAPLRPLLRPLRPLPDPRLPARAVPPASSACPGGPPRSALFDLHIARATRRSPGACRARLRQFPFNLYLRDVRRGGSGRRRAPSSDGYLHGSVGRLRGGTAHSVMRG